MLDKTYSLGEAFDYFRAHSHLSPGSLETYTYAKQYFFTFLETSPLARPLSVAGPEPECRGLSALGSHEEDVEILLWFVNYLAEGARKGRLGTSTVRLYTHAMISWFGFMVDEMLLPEKFPAALAISRSKRRLEVQPESPFRTKALGWHLSKRLGQGSSVGPDGPMRARNAHFVPPGPGGRGFRPDL